MIVVTGTRRAGTSMWMQVLRAAGFPVFGDAFPRRWSETIREANPRGFYESLFREGIYHATNPHPRTGHYVFPEQVKHHAAKIFIPGVIRSERAYLDRVVVSVRHWAEYAASLHRLQAMEQQRLGATAPGMPPVLEWWNELYSLIRDVVTRRYAVHFVSYDAVLRRPAETVGEVIGWIGQGDADAAAAVVSPALRTQERPFVEPGYPRWVLTTFEELHRHLDQGKPLDARFVKRLNEVNHFLAPEIRRAQVELIRHRRRSRAERMGAVSPAA